MKGVQLLSRIANWDCGAADVHLVIVHCDEVDGSELELAAELASCVVVMNDEIARML